jgi:hypothetical protein
MVVETGASSFESEADKAVGKTGPVKTGASTALFCAESGVFSRVAIYFRQGKRFSKVPSKGSKF